MELLIGLTSASYPDMCIVDSPHQLKFAYYSRIGCQMTFVIRVKRSLRIFWVLLTQKKSTVSSFSPAVK